jgi:hypothetical protein
VAELAPAESLVALVADRRDARRWIIIGAAILGSIVPLAMLGILTTSPMLLIATFYAPLAAVAGLRPVAKGSIAHAAASYKMHQLMAGSATLPEARLLSDGAVPRHGETSK